MYAYIIHTCIYQIKSNQIYFSLLQGKASTCKVLLTCMPLKKV